MMPSRTLCIIGTGVAAIALMQELRRRDTDTPITAIAMDAGHYSYRPNFSAAMARKLSPTDLITEAAEVWSKRLEIELHAFAGILGIDVEARILRTTKGLIAYQDLVLATGSRTRMPEFGIDARSAILFADNLPGYSDAYPTLQAASHVAIVGAGLVGCEFADDLARSGRRVTVFDPAPRPMARLIPEQLSHRLATTLSTHGVQWEMGTSIQNIEKIGSRRLVTFGSTEKFLHVDAILSAAGLIPNTAIAELAGLECLPAVPVDAHMATSCPNIYAIGDVAQPPGGWRPFVAGAQQGAKVLAARLTGDRNVHFDGTPKPISVKTRLFPMRLLPPGVNVPGQWHIVVDRFDDFVAHFFDKQGHLQAYALGGNAAKNPDHWPPLGEPINRESYHA